MEVIILMGIPGSGKSTYCEYFTHKRVFSADHYMVDKDGAYAFDPAKLPECHAKCLRGFVEYLQNSRPDHSGYVFVDNTNTSIAEIAPYAAIAQAYGFEMEIRWILVDPDLAAKRNVHSVPTGTVHAMHGRILKTYDNLPPWWKKSQLSEKMANDFRDAINAPFPHF